MSMLEYEAAETDRDGTAGAGIKVVTHEVAGLSE
jgi:hypothetical protein